MCGHSSLPSPWGRAWGRGGVGMVRDPLAVPQAARWVYCRESPYLRAAASCIDSGVLGPAYDQSPTGARLTSRDGRKSLRTASP